MKTEDLNCAVEALGVSKHTNENVLKNLNKAQKRFRYDPDHNLLATSKYELPNFENGYPSRTKGPTGQVLGSNSNAVVNEEERNSQAKEGSYSHAR